MKNKGSIKLLKCIIKLIEIKNMMKYINKRINLWKNKN